MASNASISELLPRPVTPFPWHWPCMQPKFSAFTFPKFSSLESLVLLRRAVSHSQSISGKSPSSRVAAVPVSANAGEDSPRNTQGTTHTSQSTTLRHHGTKTLVQPSSPHSRSAPDCSPPPRCCPGPRSPTGVETVPPQVAGALPRRPLTLLSPGLSCNQNQIVPKRRE